jgi:UDP-N-acetylglucosamine 2-epimerase
MKALSIIGTRPQYVKLNAMFKAPFTQQYIHDWIDTGQHYSNDMSRDFIEEFTLPKPKLNLMIGSGSHADQTARMLQGIEGFLLRESYDVVLVYGDTNSTLAGALAACKLGIPVAHIEAGLRSGNNRMPEEQNRRAVDHLSTFLFAPTKTAFKNLKGEGLAGVFSGDIMLDSLKRLQLAGEIPYFIEPANILCTLHRAENVDSSIRLKTIFEALHELSAPIIIPAHPRLLTRIHEFEIEFDENRIRLIAPLPHSKLIEKILQSKCVITDSGGIQKEAYMLQKICVTARAETEWPETLEHNWNVLNPKLENLDELISREIPKVYTNHFGDGDAALQILTELKKHFA